MPSVEIKMYDGDKSYKVYIGSDDGSARSALVEATKAIERAANLHPDRAVYDFRVEIDGKTVEVEEMESEHSVYDSVFRITTKGGAR